MNDFRDGEQRREFFRLPYPTTEQPVLVAGDAEHKVVEIAESGIRVVLNPGIALDVGDIVSGSILFHDEQTEAVSGRVLRLDASHAVVQLTRGISQHRVMQEQAYLRKKYPNFFHKP